MGQVSSFEDLTNLLQNVFERNELSLERFGKTFSTQPKIYLIESNIPVSQSQDVLGPWSSIHSDGWYRSDHEDYRGRVFLDASHSRVWRVVSLLDASESDSVIESWVNTNLGLDHCWLSRDQLLSWDEVGGWKQRGLGIRFDDGLSNEEESGKFSLKAWTGVDRVLPRVYDLLEEASEYFAIHSVRWQKFSGGSAILSAEVYSNGKITFNSATDAERVLNFSSRMAWEYADSLAAAESLRDSTFAPFELNFSQELDLDRFSETVGAGLLPMKLWLVETEREVDFRRFRGVDLHTWDRVLLDVGLDYAFLTIPGKGCVNAAPRLATLQGEDNAGRTEILHDGVELFG